MARSPASIAKTINTLVAAGEHAGFAIEQMIGLLNAEITLETLLDAIEWRQRRVATELRSSGWIM